MRTDSAFPVGCAASTMRGNRWNATGNGADVAGLEVAEVREWGRHGGSAGTLIRRTYEPLPVTAERLNPMLASPPDIRPASMGRVA